MLETAPQLTCFLSMSKVSKKKFAVLFIIEETKRKLLALAWKETIFSTAVLFCEEIQRVEGWKIFKI